MRNKLVIVGTCLAALAPALGRADAAPVRAARAHVIVLDPGHGGTNRGAFGPAIGRYEKELTLLVAKLTARELRRTFPRARVLLTRSSDRYLTLAQRAALANRWKGTLFVSIHLNASRSRSQVGFESYVLSAAASDKEASRLAQVDNPGSGASVSPPPGGRAPALARKAPTRSGLVASILGDLRQRAMHARSLHLAKAIQRALGTARPSAKDRGVHQASFDVLLGLRMPAALIEVGFIDHVVEGKRMVDPTVQRVIAKSLARGIARHLAGKPQKRRRKHRQRRRKRHRHHRTASLNR